MARKRYVSTEISIDARVRQLAERSEFAALLYTWMIPHAGDDAMITADPDELLMMVVPGFRWRTADDVRDAVLSMLELGLLKAIGDRLKFPEKAFYQYQSYIGGDRRAPEPSPQPPTNGAANHREPPQITAEKKFTADAPQNRASVSGSSSLSHSVPETIPPAPLSAPRVLDKAPAAPDRTLTGLDLWIETTVQARRHDFHDDEPDRTKRQLLGMWGTAQASGWAQREFQDVVERAVMDTKDALYRGNLHRNDEGLQKGWPLCISKIRDQLPHRRRANGARAGPSRATDSDDPSTSRPVHAEETSRPA